MSHTLGPWWISDAGNVWGYSGGKKTLVAKIVGDSFEAEFNACLIAAAPDLLEALRDFVAMGEQYEWDKARTGRDLLMRHARAAIDKAEGR